MEQSARQHYAAVIIGSGFGGTMTALPLAQEFKRRGQGEKTLILERGTWWTTPVGTVQDKELKTYDFLVGKNQPAQFWSSAEHFRGFIDIFTRCRRYPKNPDGLYDLTNFGRKGLFGLGLSRNDGVTILRASGVGGGSLVYANVTIQPPDLIFDDDRWTVTWDQPTRNAYYDLARDAIGFGALFALHKRAVAKDPGLATTPSPPAVNTGLSNIATRSARLDPRWKVEPDPNNQRGVKRIDPAHSTPTDNDNALWIDRPRLSDPDGSADRRLWDRRLLDQRHQPRAWPVRPGRSAQELLRAPGPLHHRLPSRRPPHPQQAAHGGDPWDAGRRCSPPSRPEPGATRRGRRHHRPPGRRLGAAVPKAGSDEPTEDDSDERRRTADKIIEELPAVAAPSPPPSAPEVRTPGH